MWQYQFENATKMWHACKFCVCNTQCVYVCAMCVRARAKEHMKWPIMTIVPLWRGELWFDICQNTIGNVSNFIVAPSFIVDVASPLPSQRIQKILYSTLTHTSTPHPRLSDYKCPISKFKCDSMFRIYFNHTTKCPTNMNGMKKKKNRRTEFQIAIEKHLINSWSFSLNARVLNVLFFRCCCWWC